MKSILLLLVLFPALLNATDVTRWPSQYSIRPWESDRLTEADVVGPDGIVYPNFKTVGVTGGIPDLKAPAVRAAYSVFNVKEHGAKADGTTNDDAAVAAAAKAAMEQQAAGKKVILYFPEGTYLLTSPVFVKNSAFVVDGDGPDKTSIKLAPGSTANAALFTFQPGAPVSPLEFFASVTLPRGGKTVPLRKFPSSNEVKEGDWVVIHATQSGAGTSLSDRYSNPDNRVIYSDTIWHLGRVTTAKVTAIDSKASTVTIDRTFPHDLDYSESPRLKPTVMVEFCGVQNIKIETTDKSVKLAPVKFARAANCWMKNVTITKPVNWAVLTESIVRSEYQNCHFDGTLEDINRGSTAYLGWIWAEDCLMENCRANDLRHMAIFQLSHRCVIRNSQFTGKTITSPQLHGRFPLDNLIEGCTFDMRDLSGETARGVNAYTVDGGASLRHGPNGPRNVFYHNQFQSGAGTIAIGGLQEGLIFAYNRILKTDDQERTPAIMAADRSMDLIVRGNLIQCTTALPALNIEDPTCTGWRVTDNQFFGSNGFLYSGDVTLALASNNRFFEENATIPQAAPEVPSIFQWQKETASQPRLLVSIEARALPSGGSLTGKVIRIQAPTKAPLTVTLKTESDAISVPATVTIPANQSSVEFTVTGKSSSDLEPKIVASAPGLLADGETVAMLDSAPVENLKYPKPAEGLPENWKAGDFGRALLKGEATAQSEGTTWTLNGSGPETQLFDGTLFRSGRFFVYQTIEGDGEIRAKVTNAPSKSQSGLMIADDEAAHTDFIRVEPNGRVIGGSNQNNSTHAKPIEYAQGAGRELPVWLRIQRKGSVFTVYRSSAETPEKESDWTEITKVDFYEAPKKEEHYKSPAVIDRVMHFGMFVNSGAENKAETAEFSHVAIQGTLAKP